MFTLAATDTIAGVASAASEVTCTIFGMELNAGVEAYKVLDQRQLAAAAATIYTVPASTQSFVRSIHVVNMDTVNNNTFQLFRGGTAAANAITPVFVLSPGGSAVYEDGAGWTIYEAAQITDHNHTAAGDGGVLTNDAHDGYMDLAAISVPSTPAADTLRLFARKVSARMLPKWIGPSGVDVFPQPAFFGNNICIWQPTSATAGLWIGTAGAGAGTFADTNPTTTNLYTATKRARYANVVTTTNQNLGQRNSAAMFFRGSTAGMGGFFYFARFGFDIYTAGGRLFVGLSVSTTPCASDPSALVNCLGFGIDAADSAITFMHNDAAGTATKNTISGQPTLASNQGYDVYIYAKPNDTTVYYRIDNLNTQAMILEGSVTTDLPVNTTMMTAGVNASNAALTPVNSIQLGVNRIYVESDI